MFTKAVIMFSNPNNSENESYKIEGHVGLKMSQCSSEKVLLILYQTEKSY